MTLRVLAVCTGNISRSPAVEHLLQAGLGDSAAVRSAGVRAVVGAPVDPPVAAWLASRGIDPSGFAARQLAPAMLAEADLILALTRGHRSRILELAPGAVRRTFTLREFARILPVVDTVVPLGPPGERLRALLPQVTAARALVPRRPAGEDDVQDPYGYGPEVYARSLADIETAVRGILASVG